MALDLGPWAAFACLRSSLPKLKV